MCRSFRFGTVYQQSIFSCMILIVFVPSCVCAEPNSEAQKTQADIVSEAVQENRILFRLTTLDEFMQIAGQPEKVFTSIDGGMEFRDIIYSDFNARFGKMKGRAAPFTITQLTGKGKKFDIGRDRQIVLRDANDLNKFDTFWGYMNVSLVKLDLRKHKKILAEMPFDTRTKWPEPNKLPEGFDPAQLLEDGKNPGLGVRGLHKQGIDGRGIAIAILDQPMLKDHREFNGKIIKYEGLHTGSSQMHSPPIVSIAVGENCGVAPASGVYYFAMPMTSMPDNGIYCDIIDKIIEKNKTAGPSEKVHVVSISTGTFKRQNNFDRWKKTLVKASQNGILVVTCDPDLLNYGTLERITDRNADDPSGYKAGKFIRKDNVLRVPADNRTTASHVAPDAYTFWRAGGKSWASPYLAGLAALAFQVDPQIKPDEIVQLWIETAVKTSAGPVVNPPDFIEAVKKSRQQNEKK